MKNMKNLNSVKLRESSLTTENRKNTQQSELYIKTHNSFKQSSIKNHLEQQNPKSMKT